jgi:hypothetical protein
VAVVPLARAAANPGCSVSTLKGGYAVHGQGTVVQQLPNLPAPSFQFAEVARATLDGAGNVYGTAMLNLGGIAVQGTFSGTYTVNADCTGTVTLQTSLGIPVNESLIAVSNQLFREVDNDSYIVIVRTAERIGD